MCGIGGIININNSKIDPNIIENIKEMWKRADSGLLPEPDQKTVRVVGMLFSSGNLLSPVPRESHQNLAEPSTVCSAALVPLTRLLGVFSSSRFSLLVFP